LLYILLLLKKKAKLPIYFDKIVEQGNQDLRMEMGGLQSKINATNCAVYCGVHTVDEGG
jgi:hypothetical protein